jgi:hypothetical protein
LLKVAVCSSEAIIHGEFLNLSNCTNIQVVKHLTFNSIDLRKSLAVDNEDVIDLSLLNKNLLEGFYEDYLYKNNLDLILYSCNYERIIMNMMDRFDIYKNQTYKNRRNIYYKLLGFWNEFFIKNEVDLVFFSGIPHEVADYGIYIVCKYLNINTIILTPVHQLNRVMINTDYTTPYYNEKFQILYNELNFSERINFDVTYETHLNSHMQIKFKDDIRKFQGDKKEINFEMGVPKFFKSFCKAIIRRTLQNEQITKSYKINEYFKLRSFVLKFLYLLLSYMQVSLESKKLKIEYNKSIKKDFDTNCNYILYYLHFEPESSTTPMGGFFNNQELIISTLASNMPKDWQLVVKEHWYQIRNFSGYSYLGRDFGFYSRIASFKNVTLLGHDVESFSILKGSKAVATITGSIGWEAHVLGKPVLLFGNAWYDNQPNVHRCKNTEDVIAALTSIDNFHDLTSTNLKNFPELRNTILDIHNKSFTFNYSKEECRNLGLVWDEKEIKIKLDKVIKFVSNNYKTIFN